MKADLEAPASLLERRQALRAQLQAQRLHLAQRLEPGVSGAYPRSITMRILIQRPALLIRLLERIGGRRAASVLPALPILVDVLCAALTANPPAPGSTRRAS